MDVIPAPRGPVGSHTAVWEPSLAHKDPLSLSLCLLIQNKTNMPGCSLVGPWQAAIKGLRAANGSQLMANFMTISHLGPSFAKAYN